MHPLVMFLKNSKNIIIVMLYNHKEALIFYNLNPYSCNDNNNRLNNIPFPFLLILSYMWCNCIL